MKKRDLIRKNMVESVTNERNILAMANNPFVVGCGGWMSARGCNACGGRRAIARRLGARWVLCLS